MDSQTYIDLFTKPKIYINNAKKCKCGSEFHVKYIYQTGDRKGQILDSYLNTHNKGVKHQRYIANNP